MALEFQFLTCRHCHSPEKFWTVDELANHRLAQHERPVPAAACAARLTDAATRTIGRTRGEAPVRQRPGVTQDAEGVTHADL